MKSLLLITNIKCKNRKKDKTVLCHLSTIIKVWSFFSHFNERKHSLILLNVKDTQTLARSATVLAWSVSFLCSILTLRSLCLKVRTTIVTFVPIKTNTEN